MRQQLPIIIVVVPMMLSIVNSLMGRQSRNVSHYFALAAMIICLACSVLILKTVASQGIIQYRLGGWPPPMGIVFSIDHLNAFMLVLISFIGLISACHAPKSLQKELPEKATMFWSLYLLLITGLLGITATGDMFNLFVFLEVASLAGYALVAVGNKKATVAGIRYLILGSVGASFYLLGVGYLYIATGTLNMADLANLLPGLTHSRTILLGFAFILIGISIKTALFPLHVWLPDAYTYAPSAASAVLAPLMTKVMAYVLIRVMFRVFDPTFSISVLRATDFLVWLGTLAIVFGAVTALSQNDFKRMLSYIIVAEIGYIIGGIGVANATALKGALFHIISDAVMMLCLFLIAGQVRYRKGGNGIDDFNGIFKTMPVTAIVFSVGALAVIGVPPTCGFFSKWYLLLGGIEARQWGFVAALVICTLINIALFFRIIDRGLFTHTWPAAAAVEKSRFHSRGHTIPLTMMLPAILVGIAILLIGIFNQYIINCVLNLTIF